MRKIVSGLFISLDGVVEAPDKWHYWPDKGVEDVSDGGSQPHLSAGVKTGVSFYRLSSVGTTGTAGPRNVLALVICFFFVERLTHR